MGEYQLTWITNQLAVGHAPMSYAELDSLKRQGIDAIVNLCGEYCDLHEIEEKSGFEVYYLPIPDEGAPDMEQMEKALAWLDEAMYLGKKVLVHCRFGIGRTGTFVTAYLLRRGLGIKLASKKLKNTRANPASYSQWKLLRKYNKKAGVLKIREPSLESRKVVDLGNYFSEYKALVMKVDQDMETYFKDKGQPERCGAELSNCCYEYFELGFFESIYLNNRVNIRLSSHERKELINRAVSVSYAIKRLKSKQNGIIGDPFKKCGLICPLNKNEQCLLFDYRPIRCRLYAIPKKAVDRSFVDSTLSSISKSVFLALSGQLPLEEELRFPISDVLSGRFVADYFQFMASLHTKS